MADRPAKQLLRVLGGVVARRGGILDPLSCWAWDGPPFYGPLNGDGYGVVRYPSGGIISAHLLAYEWWHGHKIAESLTLDHGCRNRSCVNPSHLQAMDDYSNAARQLLTAEQHRSLL